MVSKSIAKFIKSLQLKKYRKKEQSFLVEGAKSVLEVLQSDYQVTRVIATEPFLKNLFIKKNVQVIETTAAQLTSLGTLKNNDTAIAVVRMKAPESLTITSDEWVIVLDNINDPGNVGAILRIADWYGINKVIASEETADFYNPKVIAASKGSFCRVQMNYLNLNNFLKDTPLISYGAMMHGEDVHTMTFGASGILVMGNEANGISPDISGLLKEHITIPRYGSAESLNVAMATAIICDNIRKSEIGNQK